MNSFSLSVLKTIVCTPIGEILNFKVAYLSVMPLPEKALMLGNCNCKAGSKLEASNTSNCSIPPAALGSEITVERLEALLPTTENNCCLKGAIFKLNNLKFVGNDCLATTLSVLILPTLLCKVHAFFCAIATCKKVHDKSASSSFFISSFVFKNL